MQSEFLCARNVCKEYKMKEGALSVLTDVNLSIAKGEIVAMIGSSGAGKSTLLHILGTLDQPTSGAVIYNGINLNEISAKEQAVKRNKIFGFVFQFYYLLPDFTALENVLMPMLIGRSFSRKDFNKKQHTGKAMALLEQVGLKDRINHMPEQLSGGEKQRVAITRALINDPEILLCDEPTGNLDSKTGQDIKELLWDINKKLNRTIIIVSHDDQIANSAHRIIHIADGKISNT